MVTLAVTTRICANPGCLHQGRPLPPGRFSKGRRTCKGCDRERAKEHARKRRERLWAERKPIIDEWLGKKCVVCGETREDRLRCHEIFGRSHPQLLDTPLHVIVANCRGGRFVRTCEQCHRKSHALMDRKVEGWAEIVMLIGEFLATNPPVTRTKHLQEWRKWKNRRLKEPRQPAFLF